MTDVPLHKLIRGLEDPIIVKDKDGNCFEVGHPDWSGFIMSKRLLHLDRTKEWVRKYTTLGYYDTGYEVVSSGIKNGEKV